MRLVDLDGDGVTDAVRSGNRLECFFNDADEGWRETRQVERRALERFPNVDFADRRVHFADMNGDGLQDLVFVTNGNVSYWPSLGRGDWAPPVLMRNSPRLADTHDPERLLVGDVDGDGLADIAYVDDTRITLWINQCGNGWSAPITIVGTPAVSDGDAIRLVDLHGVGTAGVLWTADSGGLAPDHLFFLDLTGGVKPYLLTSMDNHMGAVTHVEYIPSTRFYLEDAKRPATRWKTPLPFPVQVVSRVTVRDPLSLGKLVTEYRYHHGYWDGAEREFHGFGMVEQLDTETFEDYNRGADDAASFAPVSERQRFSPPLLTRTWFHQGAIGEERGGWEETDYSGEFWIGDEPALDRPRTSSAALRSLPRRALRDALRALRGRALRTELYALDGTAYQERPYTVTEALYGVCEVITSESGTPLRCTAPPDEVLADPDSLPRIFFPHTLAQRLTELERGNDALTQLTFTGDYDAYGQWQSEIRIAVPRGRRYLDTLPAGAPAEPYLITHTRVDYARRDDAQQFMVDRVARSTAYQIANDGREDVFTLRAAIAAGGRDDPRYVVSQTLSYYDGDSALPAGGAFEGLPYGRLGRYGMLTRSETLVLTDEIAQAGYRTGNAVLNPPELPPYVRNDAAIVWTAEYPQAFRDRLPAMAGWSYRPGGPESPHIAGYFAVERRRCDFHDDPAGQGRGLLRALRDALGQETTFAYDAYDLMLLRVRDSCGLDTLTEPDYRVMQARLVTDQNGNRVGFWFTPLGLLQGSAVLGKTGAEEGDTDARPSVLYQYDLHAFHDSPAGDRRPVFVHTYRRIEHFWDRIHLENQRRGQEGKPPLGAADIDALFPPMDLNQLTTTARFPELRAFPDRFLENRDYSDGFGRLLQSRIRAERVRFGDPTFGSGILPPDFAAGNAGADIVGRRNADLARVDVSVSGWQIYDNKGRTVEKFEPFFSSGWDFAPATDAQLGQSATMFYDPRGQVIRTLKPDGSERRVIHGVPVDLTDPTRFTPTPWESYTYDANDNAGRTHRVASLGYRHHWDTPTSAEVDALGRTIVTVVRNRAAPTVAVPDPPVEEYRTRSTYDIRGNLLSVHDPLGRRAFEHVYDLRNELLRFESIDAGVRRTVYDVAGRVIERRDGKGALVLRAYDAGNRPSRLWARDEAGSAVTLRQQIEYGDGGDPNEAAADRATSRQRNRLGRSFRQYDEAGRFVIEAYDFKGNILEKTRQVIADAAILGVFNPQPANWQVPAYRVDWEPTGSTPAAQAAVLLDATERTSFAYDAAKRITSMRYPQDVDGERRVLRPVYNGAGALERVELDNAAYVAHIAYNAEVSPCSSPTETASSAASRTTRVPSGCSGNAASATHLRRRIRIAPKAGCCRTTCANTISWAISWRSRIVRRARVSRRRLTAWTESLPSIRSIACSRHRAGSAIRRYPIRRGWTRSVVTT